MSIRPIMIDSGAYSAFTHKMSLGLDGWIDFCKELQDEVPDATYVNMDVIGAKDTGEASYRNYRRMRKAGLNPLPVYHTHTDPKWLLKYLEETDYIGLSAVLNTTTVSMKFSLDRIWHDYLLDAKGKPVARLHGFGHTAFPIMYRYPWYSLDSTSWMQVGINGGVIVPYRRGGEWDYDKAPYRIFISEEQVATQRGDHFQHLPPKQKRHAGDYFVDMGFSAEELSHDFHQRGLLNSIFYAKWTGRLVWCRPCEVVRPFSLFAGPPPQQSKEYTAHAPRFFFSGSMVCENYMRLRPDHFHDQCGVLLTYFDLQRAPRPSALLSLKVREGPNKASRRLIGLVHDRPYRPGKRRKKK